MRFLLCFLVVLSVLSHGAADRLMSVDSEGVLRYQDNGEEVSLFGVNYYPPFSSDYAMLKARGFDHKAAIHQDLAHFQRLGLTCLRLHTFERQFSDKDGNFIDNVHVDLLDYLIAEASKCGIYVVLTPIAWWGSKDASPDCFTSRYDSIRQMIGDKAAWGYMARFLEQFGNHRNRYNGKRYADDPAIPVFELINEPLYEKDFPLEEKVAFINTLYDGLRKSGTKKPIFYSVWVNGAEAASLSKVEGVTHGWYPSGLVAGKTLTENYLPTVDKFLHEMSDPRVANKAKMIYEFDCADIHQSTMYPAMARAFRGSGVQIAAQFQYEVLKLADTNRNWQTHYLNLCYTPGKAIGFAIAAEVFKRIPRHFEAGRYPKSCRFGDFRVSYEEDLSELVTERDFLYSNHTKTAPPSIEKLRRVWGVGSSAVVDYDGTGAYFFDCLDDVGESWMLEIYPDVLLVRDPYSGGDSEKARMLGGLRRMEVRLPGLGSGFSARRVDVAGGVVVRAANGVVELEPGRYVLTRDGRETSFAAPRHAFVLPKFSDKVDEPAFLMDQPPLYRIGTGDLVVRATGMASSDCSRLEMKLCARDSDKPITVPLKAVRGKTGFEGRIPGHLITNPGLYRIWIEHESKGKVLVFPGGREKLERDQVAGSSWPALRLSSSTPLPETIRSEEGFEYTYSWREEDGSVRMSATGYGVGKAASGMRFALTPPPADVYANALKLRLRGGANTAAVEVGLIRDDQHGYGNPFALSSDWNDILVDLGSLNRLWRTKDGVAEASTSRELSLITGTWLYPEMRELPHFVEIQSADWVYEPNDVQVLIMTRESPVIALEFESGRQPHARRPGKCSLVAGRDPGRRALQLSASSFKTKPDFFSVHPAMASSLQEELKSGRSFDTVVLTARALYPWTNRMEFVLTESDGSPWGLNVDLSTDWQDIRIPLKSFYYFKHWGYVVEGRNGEGDMLNLNKVIKVNFCLGKFLFKEDFDKAHAVEVQEIRFE